MKKTKIPNYTGNNSRIAAPHDVARRADEFSRSAVSGRIEAL